MKDILSYVEPERLPVAGWEEVTALPIAGRYSHVNVLPVNDNEATEDTRGRGSYYIKAPVVGPRRVELAFKRAIDIAVASTSLVILAPSLLLIAGLIRAESSGLPLFRQERTGFNGKTFKIVKFRSMYTDRGDPSGVAQTKDDDCRITRLGRFLRKTNLDEIPQLWNVLVGDMSLVGPRPHVPGMLAAGRLYDELVVGYEHRHMMRPGLTGLAQSRGLRGPTTDRWKAIRRVVCDVEYVKNFSLLLDFKIAIRTLANEFRGGTGT